MDHFTTKTKNVHTQTNNEVLNVSHVSSNVKNSEKTKNVSKKSKNANNMANFDLNIAVLPNKCSKPDKNQN